MIKIYDLLVSGLVLLILDSIYITAFGKLFEKQIIRVQHTALKINWSSVSACYFLLIFGLYYFIIQKNRSVQDAFLLGILIYGVYETTTFSLLKNWNLQTVILDTLWGGILLATTTKITYLLC
jgi:uncharacterized membrane protein